MNAKSIATTLKVITPLFVLAIVEQCGSLKAPPTEKTQLRLGDELVELVHEDTTTFVLKDTTTLTLPPIALSKVAVVTPAGRTARIQDSTVVNAVITKRGNVKRAWILSSANMYFNKAVLKAVAQWKFQPALRRGVPIDTLIQIPVPLVATESE